MDIKKIIKMYTKDKSTLRHIADEFETNHHKIKRILLKQGVTLNNKNRIRRSLSKERLEQMSETTKEYFRNNIPYNKGKKAPKLLLYKNMKAHLKYEISLEWLMQFTDVEKLKFLNRSITRGRDKKGFTDNLYKLFIKKFYFNTQFNKIYKTWLGGEKDVYLKPSLDHIVPRSKGGELADLNNLQFLTWFENKCKNDMSMEDWNKLKNNMNKYLI